MATGTRTPESDMGSTRKQLNIRLDPEMEALLPDLLTAARAKYRLSGLSNSDLVRLGLLKLKDELMPEWTAPKPEPKTRKGK